MKPCLSLWAEQSRVGQVWSQPSLPVCLGSHVWGQGACVQHSVMGLHGFSMDLAAQEGRAGPGRLSSSTPAFALPVPCSSALLMVSSCLPGLAIFPSFLTLADHPGWGWGAWEGVRARTQVLCLPQRRGPARASADQPSALRPRLPTWGVLGPFLAKTREEGPVTSPRHTGVPASARCRNPGLGLRFLKSPPLAIGLFFPEPSRSGSG